MPCSRIPVPTSDTLLTARQASKLCRVSYSRWKRYVKRVSAKTIEELRTKGIAEIEARADTRRFAEDERRRRAEEARLLKLDQAQAARDSINDQLRLEIRLKQASTKEEERQIMLLHQAEQMRKGGGTDALVARWTALGMAEIREEFAQRGPGLADTFVQSMGPSLSHGLSAVIMDGFETGFRNAADIGRSILDQMLRSFLQQIISSGIAQVMGSALGGVGGGGGLGGIGGAVASVAGVATGPVGFGSPDAISLAGPAGAIAAPC